MIPLFRPSITDAEIDAVADVMRSGWLGLGPKTAEFEEAFAAHVGAAHAVGMSSGTAALHLALEGLGIGEGDEVLVPTITFASTAHVVHHLGATPVFTDVCEDTICMDPVDAAARVTARTKAILPVHYGGHPADMDALGTLAESHGLFLLEDAAHACGAEWRGARVGTLSRATCFSFHAVKNLACGEGGMVTTDDDELAVRLKRQRWLGIDKDTISRTSAGETYAWQYWIREFGHKAHLSDIAAAIGLVQLSRLDEMNAARRRLVDRYREELSGLEFVTLPAERDGALSAWHIFHARLVQRDDLIGFLKKRDIAPGVHYYPLHMHPVYRDGAEPLPVAERVWQQLISLPLYPDMTETEQDEVIGALRDFGDAVAWRPPVVEATGVRLREVVSTDLETVRAWRNDESHRRWFFDSSEISEAQQRAWWNGYLTDEADALFVIEAEGSRAVGTLGLEEIDREAGTAKLGRFLVASPDDASLGSLAVSALLDYAFQTLGLQRVWLEVKEAHADAIALYESCGFAVEGTQVDAFVEPDGSRGTKVLMAAFRPAV